MKHILLVGGFALMLGLGAGCYYDDDEDYSYRTENCTAVDLGGGEEYELCCRLKCFGEYDYDDFEESCTEEFSCTSSTDDPCPSDVVRDYGYPDCIY
jgi:hypothetical protein